MYVVCSTHPVCRVLYRGIKVVTLDLLLRSSQYIDKEQAKSSKDRQHSLFLRMRGSHYSSTMYFCVVLIH
jgi:hypothetical protein